MVLKEGCFPYHFPHHIPHIWSDDFSALVIASNPIFHAGTKHILSVKELFERIWKFNSFLVLISGLMPFCAH
jgi:hypothetical protein